jgi:hypothetical protein
VYQAKQTLLPFLNSDLRSATQAFWCVNNFIDSP